MAATTVEVTDRDGWRRELPIEKTIVHIGSDPRNDVVLENWRGGGVAPRHAQVIALPGDAEHYRLVNLAETAIELGESGERSLAPRAALDVPYGERVRLGEFTLVFHSGGSFLSAGPGAEGAAGSIGLRLRLARSQVEPDHPLTGSITVKNLGNQTGVQFKLEVDGLDPEYYEIGPAPILFPNAEKEIYFHLYHPRGPKYRAGDYRITVRATAPEAYPGDSATVSHTIRILPYYSHEVRFIDLD